MDAAILVIAADEGIKPQTSEHLVALKAKKIDNIIIAQNKIDAVSREKAIENYNKIKEFVKGTIAEKSPIIPISAQQEINLDKILRELCNIKMKDKNSEAEPIFLVARSFDINKPGTKIDNLHGGILGGALKQGRLKVGDVIEIKPGYTYKKQNQTHYKTVKSKIISIHRGSYQINEATPGGSLALETELDTSLTKADGLSGSVASTEGNLPEITEKINIRYTLFEKVFGSGGNEDVYDLKFNEVLMLSLNTSITVGQVIKAKDKIAELSLKIPVVPLKGDSIGIARNLNGHWRLIGFGEII
jgi:translation initiation factor 2 subunit 3